MLSADLATFPPSHFIGAVPNKTRTEKSLTGREAEVIWTCKTKEIDHYSLAKDAAVARRAVHLAGGFHCVVIGAREHDTMNERDEDGKLVTTASKLTRSGREAARQVPSDWHMTVAMSDSLERLHIHGHLFLYPYGEEEGELMEERPEDWREYYKDEFERTQPFEFWTLRGVAIAFKSTGRLVLPEPKVRASG